MNKIFSFFSTFFLKESYFPVEIFPKKLDKNCNDGLAQLYDECGNQLDILQQALETAQQQNKNVLIVYGAEWCLWDHVFNKYIQGNVGKFIYKWRSDTGEFVQLCMKEVAKVSDYQDAKAINKFVAENFVIAHIESENTNGKDVLEKIGMPNNIYYYPTIMILDENGKYTETLPAASFIDGLQVHQSGNKEYRGYNRKILLEQLQILKNTIK
ncbi:hypothetical protein [Pasteurella oralis]|uniref:hypothetical protein n=1 Tax=Pasteurella oralis TaxID=1071947 RepID=UPI000C7BCA67|nr:hypothetical protein [Pasteurella oralis]